MWLLKNRSRGFYLCLVLFLTLTIGGYAVAYADSGPATVGVLSGPLSESNAKNRVSLQVIKKMRQVSYTLPFMVTDARGSGSGWKLLITSTTFKMTNKNKLPNNASSIVGVSESCSTASTCTIPINRVSYPLQVPAGSPPPPPVKFFDAAAKSGLGKFGLLMMVNVTIPPGTKPGTYTTTITISIANGP
jgi:WxL domain surface cell wall-binding